MPCLLGCLALFAPRVVIVLVWLFDDWLEKAYDFWLWPVLGFFFLPFTVLAYALAWHMSPVGSIQGLGLVIVVVAVLVDLGVLGGASKSRKGRSRIVVKRR